SRQDGWLAPDVHQPYAGGPEVPARRHPDPEATMPMLSQPAFGPKLAIGFVTGGTLLDVWVLVWRYTIADHVLSDRQQFFYLGFLLTGATFFVIGALIGSIGRAARKAELPPVEATPAEANIQANAAANPHPAVAGAMMAPGMV